MLFQEVSLSLPRPNGGRKLSLERIVRDTGQFKESPDIVNFFTMNYLRGVRNKSVGKFSFLNNSLEHFRNFCFNESSTLRIAEVKYLQGLAPL